MKIFGRNVKSRNASSALLKILPMLRLSHVPAFRSRSELRWEVLVKHQLLSRMEDFVPVFIDCFLNIPTQILCYTVRRLICPLATFQVAILEKLQGDPSACQLYDYGVDENCYYLVLKHYPCSLKEWRVRRESRPAARLSRSSAELSSGASAQGTFSGSAEPFRGSHGLLELGLYLETFAAVLAAASEVAEKGIIHFDLKCDNVLLEPLPGVSEERLWDPPLNYASSVVDMATGSSGVQAIAASENGQSASNPFQVNQGNPSKASVLEPVSRSRSVHKFLRRLSSKASNRDVPSISNPSTETHPSGQAVVPVSDGVKLRAYALPFRVVLADFGQSKICRQSDVSGGVTVRNRGTEFVKSPEMLTVFHAARASGAGGPKKVSVNTLMAGLLLISYQKNIRFCC